DADANEDATDGVEDVRCVASDQGPRAGDEPAGDAHGPAEDLPPGRAVVRAAVVLHRGDLEVRDGVSPGLLDDPLQLGLELRLDPPLAVARDLVGALDGEGGDLLVPVLVDDVSVAVHVLAGG